jgi:hypothetical protein
MFAESPPEAALKEKGILTAEEFATEKVAFSRAERDPPRAPRFRVQWLRQLSKCALHGSNAGARLAA